MISSILILWKGQISVAQFAYFSFKCESVNMPLAVPSPVLVLQALEGALQLFSVLAVQVGQQVAVGGVLLEGGAGVT